jgi:hypothetical protein
VFNLAEAGRYAAAIAEAEALVALDLIDTTHHRAPLAPSVTQSRALARYVFQALASLPLTHWRVSRFDLCATSVVELLDKRLPEVARLHEDNIVVLQYFRVLEVRVFLLLCCCFQH